MARRGRCAPAAKSPTAFAANGAPRSTPISDPSSKPHGEDRSEPSTPSASPSSAAPCLAQLENVNGDLSNYAGFSANTFGSVSVRHIMMSIAAYFGDFGSAAIRSHALRYVLEKPCPTRPVEI